MVLRIDMLKNRRDFVGLGGFFFCFFVFSFVFRAAPVAYGRSQARGQIGAIATGLGHNRSELCLRPTLQLRAVLDP